MEPSGRVGDWMQTFTGRAFYVMDPRGGVSTATARRVTPSAFLAYAGPQNTPEWLAARREGIGASDIPAIVELSDYEDANPRAVYHDKRGDLPDRDAGEAAQWGHALEDAIAREWARREGLKVSRVGVIARVNTPHHRASLDRRVHGCKRGKCALEVKTRSAFKASSWREDMPDDVLAQVQWQHHVSGYDHLHVACLLGGNQLKTYVSEPEPDVITYLVDKAEKFWWHVRVGSPPEIDPSAALLSLLDRLHPNREGTLLVDDPDPVRAQWRNYDAAAAIRARAEQRMDAAKARVAILLGEHDELALPGDPLATRAADRRPTPLVRWRLQNTQRRVDLELLKADYPDAYAATVTQPQARVLRWLKGAKT